MESTGSLDYPLLAERWCIIGDARRVFLEKRPTCIIGADECGTGCLAGPVMVCAAAVPVSWKLDGLNDSKKLSRKRRELLFPELHGSLEYLHEMTPSHVLDEVGLYEVLTRSFSNLVEALLDHYPDAFVVLDGNQPYSRQAHYCLPNADAKVTAVMAASVLGKVLRDREMLRLHAEYPNYGWDVGCGYGTEQHLEALRMFGLTEYHRRSYRPVASIARSQV